MSTRIKDTDYLAISARVHAMETKLLTTAQMEQLLSVRTEEEAFKLLQDWGYPNIRSLTPSDLDEALSETRREVLEDLTAGTPDSRYIDVFRLKYDYHNIKAILKARALGTTAERMLTDLGRVPPEILAEALNEGDLSILPDHLARAAEEGRAVLDTTRDPQLADIVLDRWYYQELLTIAKVTGSEYLLGYVRIQIDAGNLLTLARALRMGKSADFLAEALIPGGEVEEMQLLDVCRSEGSGLKTLFASTPLETAAEIAENARKGISFTDIEKQCNSAVSAYLESALLTPFGEAPLIRYLAARETEYTNLRILLLGWKAGLRPEIIRTRLRGGQL